MNRETVTLTKSTRSSLGKAVKLLKERNSAAARQELLSIELGPTLPSYHRLMAAAAVIEKDFDLATSHANQAILLDPDNPAIKAEAVRVFLLNNLRDLAVRTAREIHCENFDNAKEVLSCANALISVRDYDQAIALLSKGIQHSPHNVQLRTRFAIALVCADRIQEASDQWSWCLKYDPDNTQANVSLGKIHLHRHEPRLALIHFNTALQAPGNFNSELVQLNLAEAFIQLENYAEARGCLSKIESLGKDPRFHYLWGLTQYKLQEISLAYPSLVRACQLVNNFNDSEIEADQMPQTFSSEPASKEQIEVMLEKLNTTLSPLQWIKSLRNQED